MTEAELKLALKKAFDAYELPAGAEYPLGARLNDMETLRDLGDDLAEAIWKADRGLQGGLHPRGPLEELVWSFHDHATGGEVIQAAAELKLHQLRHARAIAGKE